MDYGCDVTIVSTILFSFLSHNTMKSSVFCLCVDDTITIHWFIQCVCYNIFLECAC